MTSSRRDKLGVAEAWIGLTMADTRLAMVLVIHRLHSKDAAAIARKAALRGGNSARVR